MRIPTLRHSSAVLLGAGLFSIASLVAAQTGPLITTDECFFRNGIGAPIGYTPCTPTNGSSLSMCCYTANDEQCQPNGLCYDLNNMFSRDACTQRNWASSACSQLCPGMSHILV
jgi:hypothetical protein